MKRPSVPVLIAAVAATTLGVTAGVAKLMPQASAASENATGYATLNGGTTGGTGGDTVRATTGTQIHEALCNRASSSTPIIIEVEGTINHGNTSKVSGDSCNTASDKIELKAVSNVTIVGIGGGAVFDQLGIHLRDASNIIIQNVTVKNVKKSGSPTSNGGDAIGMESGVHNVWVDHNTLFASGGESDGYDALIDMKSDTTYVTVSYNTLRNSGRGGLIGSSDTDLDNGPVTFHHNLYENIDSRTPLLRGATAHIYNNHYVSLNKSGINSRAGAHARVESNYFEDSKDVLGTFYTDMAGSWQVSGNIFDNVTWSSSSSTNNPAGPDPQSNTTISIPYSYDLDEARCVPDIVSGTAGAGTGLKVSDGDCGAASSSSSSSSSTSSSSSSSSTSSTSTTTASQPTGTNLSIGASSDGSGKADGTSYGNVRDGDLGTYWSPKGTTGQISIKWGTSTTVSTVVIREAAGSEGAIGSWQVVDHDTGTVLASGNGAGVISFASTSMRKISFVITSASGTPMVAEFETYA
jgi:pectate lyase